LGKSAILRKDYLLHYQRSEEPSSQDFSEHSDLEPFLMTAEELESQHAHDLHFRQQLHRREWLRKSV
jgi:hypothetical protein